MNEKKVFKAVWGSGYYNPGEKYITLDDITEDNGWFPENIEAIDDLQIGQTCDCSDFSGDLHVTRIA